jgi:hypothetical protein
LVRVKPAMLRNILYHPFVPRDRLNASANQELSEL